IIIIMLVPIFGLFLYIAWGGNKISQRMKKFAPTLRASFEKHLPPDPEISEAFLDEYPEYTRISRYLELCGYPLTEGGNPEYLPLGELFFDRMIADMKKAEKTIFIQFFIIADGEIWHRIFAVLREKVRAGVEVRVMYDDGGSLFTVHSHFRRELEEAGIKVQVFNPVHKSVASLYFNYRNHQKIAIIDGNIGYTGGINVGDEYANITSPRGHWKDTGIRVTGDSVWTMTVVYLQMWDQILEQYMESYDAYRPTIRSAGKGYFQFFADGPANNPENPALQTYLQMITTAKDYIYITSPYLILSDHMMSSLKHAAESGVDVRIFTTHVRDHWYVHLETRSFYGNLLESGVRVYEYTPGFLHCKMVVSDDKAAIVGSINMDYRSFFLQYECAYWMCGTPAVMDVKQDILEIMEKSEEIQLEAWKKRPFYVKAAETVLRLAAPLF
ncbi:cardiolipin synthase, partial [Oscillospiraceae bacterium OttesenSCG-928-F05]|nr:cardiolipin synthase [Oscillospiraceae bacterium OttesenSCG-928-F05]